MSSFKKYLIVSKDSGQTSTESWNVERFPWQRAAAVHNLADYDGVVLDLAALKSEFPSHIFDGGEIKTIFDRGSWAHILGSNGKIILVGDPNIHVAFPASSGFRTGGVPRAHAVEVPKYSTEQPIAWVLNIGKDPRPFDFRRVTRNDEAEYPVLYKYLDRVNTWNYSLSNLGVCQELRQAFANRQIALNSHTFGLTTFNTYVAAEWSCRSPRGIGKLVILPSATTEEGADAIWIAREFLGIATAIPAPLWTKNVTVPGQVSIKDRISKAQEKIASLRADVTAAEQELSSAQRWLRLLYDDGFSLEEIVKEAFENLGATVSKTSREKDDYRVEVDGYPQGVMEVKGNAQSEVRYRFVATAGKLDG